MAANPNSFDHYRRGEPLGGIAGKVTAFSFDHYRRGGPPQRVGGGGGVGENGKEHPPPPPLPIPPPPGGGRPPGGDCREGPRVLVRPLRARRAATKVGGGGCV